MKRNLFVVLSIVVMASTMACNKYSEVISLNNKFVGLMEEYIADLDKADNAKDVASAMNSYADELEDLWPKMKKTSEKYPELKDPNNIPEELKASQKEAEQVGQRFAGSMMKIMPYMGDPEVRKAQQRLGKIMGS